MKSEVLGRIQRSAARNASPRKREKSVERCQNSSQTPQLQAAISSEMQFWQISQKRI